MEPERQFVWTIPLLPTGANATLVLPSRTISADNWAQMLRVLDAMKPALVGPDDDRDHPAGGTDA